MAVVIDFLWFNAGGVVIQAVILAAGRGSRLSPLTQQVPKALLSLGGQTLLQRLLTTLNELDITSVTIGIGWKSEQIHAFISKHELSMDVRLVEVPNYEVGPLQTLVTSIEGLSGPTLICPVDYVVAPEILRNLLSPQLLNESTCILHLAVSAGSHRSPVYGTDDGILTGVGDSVLAGSIVGYSAMALVASTHFLELCRTSLDSGMTSVRAVINYAALNEKTCYIQVPLKWADIDRPTDLFHAAQFLVNHMSSSIDGLVVPPTDTFEIGTRIELSSGSVFEPDVKIVGPAYIGSASLVGHGCRIGPNAFIEPNTTLEKQVDLSNVFVVRGTTLAADTKIQHSIVFNKDRIQIGD